jgi:hypothetical protein
MASGDRIGIRRRKMGMTKKELIEALADFPDDMPVRFVYNYGDHWRTWVAAEICDVQPEKVKYDSYHSMDRLATDRELESEEELELTTAAGSEDDDQENVLRDVIALR